MRPQAHTIFPAESLTRRLRRGWWGCHLMGSRQLRRPKVSKERAEVLWCARKRIPIAPVENDAPTTARIGTYRPMGRSHFSFDGERKVCKRKPAARRLQRRPTSLCTAAKPCAALGLGYALHGFQPFLALVGLRPPLAVGFGLREPFGLSSTSARCAHPPGKSPLLPILTAGLATSRAI